VHRTRWVAAGGALAVVAVLGVVGADIWRTDEPGLVVSAGPSTDPACTHYVSTAGEDGAAGSADQPWRTVGASLEKLASPCVGWGPVISGR
jgi:hypothetical protein